MRNLTWLFLLIPVVVVSLVVLFLVRDVRLAMQARELKVGVSFSDIFAMRFRKIEPRAVIDALGLAQQHNLDISVDDMQLAYLQGVDLEKAVFNLAASHAGRGPVTVEQLVEADSQK